MNTRNHLASMLDRHPASVEEDLVKLADVLFFSFGGKADNSKICKELGWELNYFFPVRNVLLDAGLLTRIGGLGGGSKLTHKFFDNLVLE